MATTLEKKVTLPKIRQTECFIAGEWVPAVSGRTFETINPATEETIAQVAEGDEADIDLAVSAARDALAHAREHGGDHWLPLDAVRLQAPLMPPVILNSGQNYWDHRDEKPEVDQKDPEFFLKASLAVIGPHEPVILDPIVTKKLDYEVELAVVIGKPGRHIPVHEALEHVFGYTVANDITARDRQAVPHQHQADAHQLHPHPSLLEQQRLQQQHAAAGQ